MVGISQVTVSPVASSPGENLTGNPRVVRDILADVYKALQKWNDLIVMGARIVREIAIIRANNPKNHSVELKFLTRKLFKLIQRCCLVCEEISIYYARMLVLDKLNEEESSLFMYLSVEKMADMIKKIQYAYSEEIQNKQMVVQDIARLDCDYDEIDFALLWINRPDIIPDVTDCLEALLTEAGQN